MKIRGGLSLRARLGLLYAILLIISVFLVGCFSYWNIWQLFINNKSTHLRARAKPIIEHWLVDNSLADPDSGGLTLNPESALMLARDLTSRETVAIILNQKGQTIAHGKRLPEEPYPPHPDREYLRRALSGENEVTYLTRFQERPVLVLLIPLRPRPGSPRIMGVVQMSASLTDIHQILFRHGTALMALAAVILVSGIAAGFWLIGANLNELHTLSTTCNQISKGNLSRRVPVKNRQDEVGQLADSFNRMIDQLEATFASRQRFAANAAHELLTPLTGLRGSLEVLLRGAQDDAAARARLLKGMYGEINRLIRLCEQLLGLSRLEGSSNLQKQSIPLSDFFEGFGEQARILACGRSLVIKEGPYARVCADPDLLKQILLNLLSNAFRYSTMGTEVHIGWKLLPEQVEIWVSDRGEGMDAQTVSHVFEPFYRGKSPVVAGEKGLGLGLSLARSMVEAHKGAIRIESEPGMGTTVSFTLPLN